MTVYVDDMRAKFGRMIMCPMIADSDEELHAMADRLGLKRCWHQAPPKASHSHYDISLSVRARAVAAGAVQITWRQLAFMRRRERVEGSMGKPEEAEAWWSAQNAKIKAEATRFLRLAGARDSTESTRARCPGRAGNPGTTFPEEVTMCGFTRQELIYLRECVKRDPRTHLPSIQAVFGKLNRMITPGYTNPAPRVEVDEAMALARGAWRAGITLGNNICVQESDRENDRDGDSGWINGTAECAKRIREWVEPDDAQLLELLAEAGVDVSALTAALNPEDGRG